MLCKSCDNPVYIDGLCYKHYVQWEAGQPVWIETKKRKLLANKIRICPKCKVEHDASEFPPSLERKMKVCFKCYKKAKKIRDAIWRKFNPDRIQQYKLRAKKKASKARGTQQSTGQVNG